MLGSVVLAVTGAEALYADMGHFGKRPIRLAWFLLVLPALLLNYLGQGALLLDRSRARSGTRSTAWCPRWVLYPVVVIATRGDGRRVAGAHLGGVLAHAAGGAARLLPRVDDRPHLRATERADLRARRSTRCSWWLHRASCSASRSSTHSAAAYGIAVTGTMSITTLLLRRRTRARWGWPLWAASRWRRLPRGRSRLLRRQRWSSSSTAAGSPWSWPRRHLHA